MIVVLLATVFGFANSLVGYSLAKNDESISTFVTALPLVLGAALVVMAPFAVAAA